MKLKNKKTGEIKEVQPITIGGFRSLAELNEEWEDAPEEPKELYWVNYDGSISHAEEGTMSFVKQKQIGNCFETKEEAEKAVEKLKAWKLLKDECDIKFDGIIRDDRAHLKGVKLSYDRHEVTFDRMRECMGALHLLFGGEE